MRKRFVPIVALVAIVGLLALAPTAFGGVPTQCTISGTNGDDNLSGTPGSDKICGYAGHDTVFGWDGDDTVTAGKGKDRVNGGDGCDTIRGGPGADDLQADGDDCSGQQESGPSGLNGGDHLEGNGGNDRCVVDPNDTYNSCETVIVTGGGGGA